MESSNANCAKNLLWTVILVKYIPSHVVGTCWYLFGLQRVNQCLQDACHDSGIARCMRFIDCGHGNDYPGFASDPTWDQWKNNENATACFTGGDFSFRIYAQAVNLTTEGSVVTRYVYALFWRFQASPSLHGSKTKFMLSSFCGRG
ncbi:hypothetical protein ACH5RR_008754 [Cinchona calisaya]|uniref:Uncharacterized protein n=1 Tax=Cinchona calisaya TaxID=153742 RepID=A0ABD3AF90_9GENT